VTETNSSGTEVPNATMVQPISHGATPNERLMMAAL